MRIVLVEFGSEDREAEAFKTVAGAREYFVNEIEYLSHDYFNLALKNGSVEDCANDIYLKIYDNYNLGD